MRFRGGASIKNVVYAVQCDTMDPKKVWIETAFRRLTPDMLRNVQVSMNQRAALCIKYQGDPSNPIFKNVHLIVTEHAKHFFKMSELPSDVKVYDDSLEWQAWKSRGDPVLHIELGKMADIMVIAPLDANTLAKMSQGICDNLLTCTTRAWDISRPLLFCPAMNTKMWDHPITSQQVATLKSWGHIEIPPISKKLMCGDTGIGAMAEVETIVEKIKSVANEKFNVTFD